MQMFIPSVLSALGALFKYSAWLLWRVFSIFSSRSKFPPPQRPSSDLYSPSDSPYKTTPSQQRPYHPFRQPRPAVGYSQIPSQHSTHQTPSQHSPYQPRGQPSAQYPTRPTPLVPRDVSSVAGPVSCIPEAERPHRPYARVPEFATRAPEVDVAPIVIDPRVSSIPERPRRPDARVPEIATRTPEVDVTPIVIDPHEDHVSLRLKARNEKRWMEKHASLRLKARNEKRWTEKHASLRLKARNEKRRMEKCLKQGKEAKACNKQQLAEKLTLKSEAHRENMTLLSKKASAKIFQENNQKCRLNTVDLHRLHVPEALFYFEEAVQGARDRGESFLRVIVGKGNHSNRKTPRIKPAIQAHARESLGLSIKVDPSNDGCLIVTFN